jgi:hypothetical protein
LTLLMPLLQAELLHADVRVLGMDAEFLPTFVFDGHKPALLQVQSRTAMASAFLKVDDVV